MDLLISIAAFIVAIAILVAVHEFGHFWVAKKLGVKVLRFSIGFGKILKSYTHKETTYTVCAIPLGCFVKMLDENETEVDESEKHRAFNNQNVYKRIAIVAAGPIANFLLAIFLYTIVFVIGIDGIKPIVDSVNKESIAQTAGIRPGDQLLSVNSKETKTTSEFTIKFIESLGDNSIHIQAKSKLQDLKIIELNIGDDFLNNPEQGVEKYLGFNYKVPKLPAVIDKVFANTPAEKSGLKSMDEVVEANGVTINSWKDFATIIRNNTNNNIDLTIKRNNSIINISLMPEVIDGSTKAGVSVFVPNNYLDDYKTTVKYDLYDAFILAIDKTYQLTILNLKMIKKMLFGDASVDGVSGPLSIANFAGKSAQIGIESFLSFLALISIGLGLINLLPIPLLDGGHLLFYLIEIIKGSKVDINHQQIAFKFGIFVILSLTFIALYNDVSRLF